MLGGFQSDLMERDALKKLSYDEGAGAAFFTKLNGQVFL